MPYEEGDVMGRIPYEILSALFTSLFAIPNATNTSSQITAAKEFNPDDKVLNYSIEIHYNCQSLTPFNHLVQMIYRRVRFTVLLTLMLLPINQL